MRGARVVERRSSTEITARCAAEGAELPARYHRLFKIWFLLGWPAFLSLIAIFYLMVAKPV